MILGFWIQRHSDPLERLARGIGEPDGPLPLEGFIRHLKHQHVQPRIQRDAGHFILLGIKGTQEGISATDLKRMWSFPPR